MIDVKIMMQHQGHMMQVNKKRRNAVCRILYCFLELSLERCGNCRLYGQFGGPICECVGKVIVSKNIK